MTDKQLSIFQPEGADVDEEAIRQIVNCLSHPDAVAGALMADHHLGYAMPIGGVVAYQDAISPTGVGFDIACGNMAVQTNIRLRDLLGVEEDCPPDKIPYMEPEEFNTHIKPIMRQIQKKIEFGVGGSRSRSAGWVDDPVMDDSSTWHEIDRQFGTDLKEKARAQLGTVGAGNHYVDLLVDSEGWVWIANHFGSRGLGHTIASGFMAVARGLKFTDRVKESEEPIVFPTTTELGEFYIAAMHLAGKYAYAGREFVIGQVLEILGAKAQFSVHNHHNFAWFENGMWIVRKGATPLTAQPAFIGGSMGDVSVIVHGKEQEADWGAGPGPQPQHRAEFYPVVEDIGALGSAPHGAGRVMSRTKAAGKMRKMISCSTRDCDWLMAAQSEDVPEVCPECGSRKFRKIKTRDPLTAAIDWTAARAQLLARGITVLGAGADESPAVYKPLEAVLAAHQNIEVLNVLRPIGVVMAGPDTYDPYKD